MPVDGPPRCAWATKPATIAYHDREWGVPTHDDRTLFEFLILEGAQAGLSWETILGKREHYRKVFAHFDPAKVARYGERDVARLVTDAGIVRHRGKIESAIANARAVKAIAREHGSFDAYVWSYVDGTPIANAPRTQADVPATSPLAERFSRDLRARGCSFVGPTIVYAFMQATGLIDDHLVTCFRSAAFDARPSSQA
jgi:DNA-3-methyladenine glycosylase I